MLMPICAMQIWLPGPKSVQLGEVRQRALVRAPAHLGGGDALLVEALDGPGVDELVDLLRPVGDLRVALADVDDLGAGVHGQTGEVLVGERRLERGPAGPSAGSPRSSIAAAMSSSATLVQWLTRPGLAPCSTTAVGPGSLQLSRSLRSCQMAHVEGALGRRHRGDVLVGVPDLGRPC